jgi:hypothetical protein
MHPRDQSTGDPANSTGPTDGQHWGPAHQARYRAELGQGPNHPGSYSVGSGATSGRDRTDQIDAGRRRKRINSERSFSGQCLWASPDRDVGGVYGLLSTACRARGEWPKTGDRASVTSGHPRTNYRPLSGTGNVPVPRRRRRTCWHPAVMTGASYANAVEQPAVDFPAPRIDVNGNRKLISCRQVKIDQFRVHSVSAGSVWTRPRSRFLSR